MKPISEEAIAAVPDAVEATKESCEAAADAALLVLFMMAGELEPVPSMPPILSNGVEVYPLPAPWEYRPPLRIGGEKIDTREVQKTVNEFLPHIKKTAEAYNEALELNDRPTAERCAAQAVNDSATIWSTCNALAMSVETASVYRTLELSAETHGAYHVGAGVRP